MTIFYLHWRPNYIKKAYYDSLEDAQAAYFENLRIFQPNDETEIQGIPTGLLSKVSSLVIDVYRYDKINKVWNKSSKTMYNSI